jgi:hypothetical protein
VSSRLNYFRDISQEGHIFKTRNDRGQIIDSVKNARFNLEEAVKQRYNDLEKNIEKLRAENEKSLDHSVWQFWK